MFITIADLEEQEGRENDEERHGSLAVLAAYGARLRNLLLYHLSIYKQNTDYRLIQYNYQVCSH